MRQILSSTQVTWRLAFHSCHTPAQPPPEICAPHLSVGLSDYASSLWLHSDLWPTSGWPSEGTLHFGEALSMTSSITAAAAKQQVRPLSLAAAAAAALFSFSSSMSVYRSLSVVLFSFSFFFFSFFFFFFFSHHNLRAHHYYCAAAKPYTSHSLPTGFRSTN